MSFLSGLRDVRRRRRLAQEADGAETESRRASGKSSSGTRNRVESPADTLISPRLWKHIALWLVGLVVWGAVLYVGDVADRYGDGWQSILGLKAGKLAAFFSTVMLLSAGQLGFISLWYRSRSLKDFSGSYKVWLWAAIGWLTLCAFRATGSHWSLADAVLKQHTLSVWNARLLTWLIPVAIGVMTLYRLLLREMRDCRLSLWIMRLSAVVALASAVDLLVGPYFLQGRNALLLEVGSSTLWHLLLATGMLLHARHVVHFSNEPPVRPIQRVTLPLPRFASLGMLIPKFRRREKVSKVKTEKPPARSRSAKKDKVAEPAAELKAATKETSKRYDLPELPPEPVAEAVAKPVQAARPTPQKTAEPVKASAAMPQRRFDQAQPVSAPKAIAPQSDRRPMTPESDDEEEADGGYGDSEDFDGESRGLSKKERKKLRKIQKQQQRAGRE